VVQSHTEFLAAQVQGSSIRTPWCLGDSAEVAQRAFTEKSYGQKWRWRVAQLGPRSMAGVSEDPWQQCPGLRPTRGKDFSRITFRALPTVDMGRHNIIKPIFKNQECSFSSRDRIADWDKQQFIFPRNIAWVKKKIFFCIIYLSFMCDVLHWGWMWIQALGRVFCQLCVCTWACIGVHGYCISNSILCVQRPVVRGICRLCALEVIY
jgi:hypothetical protein